MNADDFVEVVVDPQSGVGPRNSNVVEQVYHMSDDSPSGPAIVLEDDSMTAPPPSQARRRRRPMPPPLPPPQQQSPPEPAGPPPEVRETLRPEDIAQFADLRALANPAKIDESAEKESPPSAPTPSNQINIDSSTPAPSAAPSSARSSSGGNSGAAGASRPTRRRRTQRQSQQTGGTRGPPPQQQAEEPPHAQQQPVSQQPHHHPQQPAEPPANFDQSYEQQTRGGNGWQSETYQVMPQHADVYQSGTGGDTPHYFEDPYAPPPSQGGYGFDPVQQYYDPTYGQYVDYGGAQGQYGQGPPPPPSSRQRQPPRQSRGPSQEQQRPSRRPRRTRPSGGPAPSSSNNNPSNNNNNNNNNNNPDGNSKNGSAPPVNSAARQAEIQHRIREDERKEKAELLHRLYMYEKRGYQLAGRYSMNSNVDELRFEYTKLKGEESTTSAVKWYKIVLMGMISVIETLNAKFDPFGLRLDGWSTDMMEKKDDLDGVFGRLHDKWSTKSNIEPELELIIAIFGGGFMYHLQNTLGKGGAGGGGGGGLGALMGGLLGGGGGGGGTPAGPQAPTSASPFAQPPMPKFPQHPSPFAGGGMGMGMGSASPTMTNMPMFFPQQTGIPVANPQQQQYGQQFGVPAAHPQQYPHQQQHPRGFPGNFQPPSPQPATPPTHTPTRGPSGRRVMQSPATGGINGMGGMGGMMGGAGGNAMSSLLPMMMAGGGGDNADVPIPTDIVLPEYVGGYGQDPLPPPSSPEQTGAPVASQPQQQTDAPVASQQRQTPRSRKPPATRRRTRVSAGGGNVSEKPGRQAGASSPPKPRASSAAGRVVNL